jgi:hypothetical protein
LALALLVVLRSRSARDPLMAPGHADLAIPAQHSAQIAGELPVAWRSDAVVDDEGEPTDRAELDGHIEEPETSLSRARESMLEANADIADYRRLRLKALLTAEERDQLHRMLKNPTLIEAAKRDLVETGDTFSREEQLMRMARVEYLDAALEWKDNPERAAVLDAAEEALLAPNIRASQDRMMQHSVAGDKVELYLALQERDPAKAAEIASKAKGTDFEKLITYAQAKYDAATDGKGSGG